MCTYQHRVALVLFLIALLLTAPALAADDAELEEIVVTAERSQQDVADTARAVEIVTEKQLLDSIGRTVPESLRRAAGVSVQRTNLGGGAPFIRGLVGNQVLYLVDGVRVNNSTFRGGPNQYLSTIDPFFIERIELVRGPGSVLYGSDALGGTINVITKRRKDFGDYFGLDGRLMQRATTAEKEVTSHLGFDSNISGLFGMSFSGNFRQFGDIDPGGSNEVQTPSGYEEQDFAGNADFHMGDKVVWEFSAQHVNFDRVPNYDPGNPKNRFEPQRRNLYYTRLSVIDLTPGLDNITAFTSYQEQTEGRERIKADDLDHEQRDLDRVDTAGAGLQLESAVGRWARFIYGGEFYHDMISSEREIRERFGPGVEDVDPQFPDNSTFTTAAGYLEVRVTPWEWMKLVPGVRYSHFAPNAKLDDPNLGQVTIDEGIGDVTWAVHSLWKPHNAHGIILGVARGFRAPSLEELTKLGSEDGRFDVPNPDLEPETLIQYELGYRVSYPRLRGSFFAYYSDIADLITRKPTTYNGQDFIGEDEVSRNENVGEAYIYGYEAQLSGIILKDLLHAGGAFAYTFGENKTDEEPIRRIPPPTGNAYVRALWNSQNAWFEIASDFAGKQERLSDADKKDSRIGPEGTDGFAVMHLRSGFTVGQYFEITMAVENLFDEPYKYHGSGPLEAGRNFKGQLSFLF
ncbi:MAG: TonB-dependent receptor [Candidatus Lernaella stagnicola]|nr:TonB-dependent receptor [Candidatus Lernaella stagnicola]